MTDNDTLTAQKVMEAQSRMARGRMLRTDSEPYPASSLWFLDAIGARVQATVPRYLVHEPTKPPVDHDVEAYRLQSDSLRHRMSKAIGLLSTIQASGVLEAHGHDDLNECLEEALGALVGRKE